MREAALKKQSRTSLPHSRFFPYATPHSSSYISPPVSETGSYVSHYTYFPPHTSYPRSSYISPCVPIRETPFPHMSHPVPPICEKLIPLEQMRRGLCRGAHRRSGLPRRCAQPLPPSSAPPPRHRPPRRREAHRGDQAARACAARPPAQR